MFDDLNPYQVNPWDPKAEWDQIYSEVEQLYGPDTPFTDEQRAEMALLQQQARGLAPVDFGQMGSAAIAGNPFSVDTRGLFTGLGSLVAAVINKDRNERLYGNAKKSEEAGKKADAIETNTSRFDKKVLTDDSNRGISNPLEIQIKTNGMSQVDDAPTSFRVLDRIENKGMAREVYSSPKEKKEVDKQRKELVKLREKQRVYDPTNSIASRLLALQEQEKRAALREQNVLKFMEQRYPEAYERLQRSNDMALTRKAQLEREQVEQEGLTERARLQADAQKNREKSDQYRITASIMDRVANSTSGYKDAQFEYQNYQKQLQAAKKDRVATPEQKAELERLAGESKVNLDASRRAYNEALISLIEENGFKVPESIKKNMNNLSANQKDELLSSIYGLEWDAFSPAQKGLLRTAWDEGTLSTYLAQTGKIEQPQPIEEGIIDLTGGF